MRSLAYLILFCAISTQAAPEGSRRLREEFKSKTRIENPFDLRDPFKRPVPKNDRDNRTSVTTVRDGVFTNVPPIGELSVENIQVVGVLIGRDRRAMVRVGGAVVVLREGMRIGKDGAELKAIHPGGIILVEKLVNVYGEEEYLETVIPISQ
jgi:Tfp pilus assembly protein PilP